MLQASHVFEYKRQCEKRHKYPKINRMLSNDHLGSVTNYMNESLQNTRKSVALKKAFQFPDGQRQKYATFSEFVFNV